MTNRMLNPVAQEASSDLMGTLAIMGFSAEANLRDVAQALGRRDSAGLARVVERNAKQSRLRTEIENQLVGEMSLPTVSTRSRRKLILVSQVALMFERMGARTVEIAEICDLLIREPRPSRVNEIKKLIEHAVYITDRAVTALIKEDISTAQTAVEQKRAATELNGRINRELSSLNEAGDHAPTRRDLLGQITCKAHGMIEEAGQLAHDVIAFLEKAEL